MMKKLISALAALVLALSFTATAFAYESFAVPEPLGEPLPPRAIYDAPEIPAPEFMPAPEYFPSAADFSQQSFNSEMPYAPLDDGSAPTSGSCGNGAVWSFDRETGVLSVSGQGDIYDYDYDNGSYAPWYVFREEITDISVSSGITSIGNNAFRGLSNAAAVNIPESVSKIGNNSFSDCFQLKGAALPDGIVFIGYNAFANTYYMYNLRSDDGYYITPNGYLLKYDNVAESVSVPENVKLIASRAFYYPYWTKLYYAEINSDCIICDEAFIFCYELEKVVINGSCKITGSMVKYGDGLKSIIINGDCAIEDGALADWCNMLETVTINGNCTASGLMVKYVDALKSITIGGDLIVYDVLAGGCGELQSVTIGGDLTVYNVLADGCVELQNVTIGGRLNLISGSFVINCPKLTKISYNTERAKPAVSDNTTGKTNRAVIKMSRSVSCLPHDANLNTYSDRTEYNNGFGYFIPRRCAQEIEAPDGTVYVACGVKDVMQIVSPHSETPILEIRRSGFDFAAACIDNEYNWYIMWSYKIPNEIAQGHLEDENIVIAKYTFTGQLIGECKMKVGETSAPLPLDFGSASMAVKDNILGVFYNTVWLNGHQGAEFAAINKESMELVHFSDHQGSHAFGTVLLPTENGFTGAHLGDGYPRGIAFHSYYVFGSSFKITSNGPVLMHSNGDDTDTHTHWGGFAAGKTTYAVVGKSERFYTSGSYQDYKMNHPSEADIFDVFIRIVDRTLLDTDDIGGEDRIDDATGEVADSHVFWLTSCNSTEKAGQVKVVTLENGAYCVLWEKMVNGKFDGIRYVIMDECGNILRRETAIYGARLSNTSVQPIVQGSKLIWATADAEAGKVTWYTVNLDAFGDVNKDGVTTLDDAVLTLQKAMNVNLGYVAFDDVEADINCDGQITLDDAIEILKIAMNVIA